MKQIDSDRALDIQSIRLNSLRAIRAKSYRLSCSGVQYALCRVCAMKDDCRQYQVAPLETGQTCALFQPILVFLDDTNLDKQDVNTIRLGAAWRDRLHVGDHIGLFDKTNMTLRKAEVTNVAWDYDKNRLMSWSAKHNHLGMMYESPASELKKTLIRLYGTNFYNNAKGLTVIFFRLL